MKSSLNVYMVRSLWLWYVQDGEDDEKAEISKREKARLKEMQKLKKQKILEMLDSQNASIDADMNNKEKGRLKYLGNPEEIRWFCHVLRAVKFLGNPEERVSQELSAISDFHASVDRSARSPFKLVSRFPYHPDIATLHDNFEHVVHDFRDYMYLGTRVRIDGTVGDYLAACLRCQAFA